MPRTPPGFKNPPSYGQSKKKRRKNAPSPEDVHTGRHAPPDRRPPKQPPVPAAPPSPEDHRHETPQHRPPAPPAWVTRRQRQLRAAGYKIRVDGKWGAVSQNAWHAYQRGIKPAKLPKIVPPKNPLDLGRLTPVPEITQGLPPRVKANAVAFLRTPDGRASGGTRRADAAQQAVVQRNAAVQREIRQTKAVARKARQKPPAKMSLEDLVAITIAPVTHEFNPQSPADAKRVQMWLRAHGHKGLKVDGIWGKATFKALQTSYFAAQKQEAQHRTQRVTRTLYDSKILRPGQNVPGLGHVAGPGDLIRHLQGNTFGAATAWAWISQQMRDHPSQFLAWRDQQLLRLEWGGATRKGGAIPVNPLITNNLDRYLRLAANLPQGGGGKQIGALVDAKSIPDLNRRLSSIARYDAARYRHEVESSKHHGWWEGALNAGGTGLSWISYPGVKVKEQALLFAATFREATRTLQDPYSRAGGSAGIHSDIRQEARSYEKWLQDEHPWMNLGLSIALDPLSYAFPWTLAGAGIKAGVRGGTEIALQAEKLGYGISRSGSLIRYKALVPVSKTGLALTVPARSGRLLRTTAQVEMDAIKASRPGQAISFAVEKATALKSEAISVARARVARDARHGFSTKTLKGRFPEEVITTGRGAKPDTVKQLEQWDEKIDKYLNGLHPQLLSDLHRSGLSLFSHVSRDEHSGIGAAILARMAEVFRTNQVKRLALQRARDEWRGITEDGTVNLAAGEARARVVYLDYLQRGGAYIRGAHDAELAREITPRVYQLLDQWEATIFRKLQDRIEKMADDAGRPLFEGDSGRWIGRDSEARHYFRALGADAFDPKRKVPIKNTRFGEEFTVGEKDQIVDDEIRGETGRFKAWFYRERAEGRAMSDDYMDTRITEIIRDANKGWRQKANGKWEDTRRTILVPDIYARQLRHLYGEVLHSTSPLVREKDLDYDILRGLREVAARPQDAFESQMEKEFEQYAYILAGGPSEVTGGLAVKTDPHIFDFLPQTDRATRAQHDAIRKAVDEASAMMGRAYNESLPTELRREWALMAALKEAQGFVGRNTYRAIQGGTSAWIILTLPLRSGWIVRNVVDNTAKAMTRGVVDPRHYLSSGVLTADLRAVLFAAEKMDSIFGTRVAEHYGELMDRFWGQRIESLQKIFHTHGIEVPAQVLEEMRFNPFEHGQRLARPSYAATGKKVERGALASFRDGVWELFASKPENYAKRILYRKKYAEVLAETGDETRAFKEAWAEVEHTLFDYSKVTVIEDTLKPLFPFMQFWRKNTKFWLQTAVEKPYLPYGLVNFEEKLRDQVHADLPDWQRRYIHTDEIADGLNQIPGLGWLARPLADSDSMVDPVSFFSFAPLYRTFKSENPNLPGEQAGLPFLSGMIDAMNDWGLSMNPLIRKPLEWGGVANYRSWQSIFPQTPVVQAFTRKYLNERFPNGLNIEAWIQDATLGQLFDLPNAQEKLASDFNQYVQMEMANQALRGEEPNRAKAEKKLQDFFLVFNIVGYFGGVYARRATPQDQWLWKLSDDFHKHTKEWNDLTPKEQQAYQLYKRRKLDPVEFDRYVSLIPLIQAYFGQPNYATKESMKLRYPEIVPFVEPAWSGKGLQSEEYLHHAQLAKETGTIIALSNLASELKLSPEVRDFAENLMVTRELKEFWAANDTPAETREKQIKGQFFHYIGRLTDTYFAIPEDDFDAKNGFLKQHPVLEHWWLQNNTNSDDFKAIINASNADLRELYFEHLDNKDYKSADAFLHQYPFIFEFTKAADRVDPEGNWIGNGKGHGHGRHGLSQHAQDYLAAKSALSHYFALGESIRSKWLAGGSPDALKVKAYFAKYSHFHGGQGRGTTQHARDYLAVAPLLTRFFKVAKARGFNAAWDSLDKKEAAKVQAYFRKYAHPKGHSQHAKDYMENKKALEYYFSLDKSKRDEWLHGGSPRAEAVLAYFKKWSKTHQVERAFRNNPTLKSLRPELAMRLKFWQKLFSLDPSARPEFILENAEKYGVFIYGPIGQSKRNERFNDWLRQGYAHGLGDKAAVLLYVKPLLDYFFKLKTRDQKQLFLKANPELDYYFRNFVKATPSGDAKLDRLLEQYFALPEHSPQRSDFIKRHHEVQVYFNSKSTPAERAIRNQLEVYFGLYGPERKMYGLQHPEIQAYFDQRANERDAEQAVGEAFAKADPRLRRFWDMARLDITLAGEQVREAMFARRKLGVRGLATRRERSA